jgi:hypothetical protein
MNPSGEAILAEEVCPQRKRAELRRHALFLGLAVFIAAMAFALEVRRDERVNFRGLPDWPLPHTCYSRAMLGVSCPGCGLTRSFVYLARGQWRQAWSEHRLGWLLAAIVAFQIPYRTWALGQGGRSAFSPHQATAFAVVLLILLVANWGLQMLGAS